MGAFVLRRNFKGFWCCWINQKDGLFSAKNLNLKGSVSDDLLLMGFEINEEKIKVHLYPVEVKIGKNGTNVIEKAIEQVTQTASVLRTQLTKNTFKSTVYYDFLIQLAITSIVSTPRMWSAVR